VKDLMKKRKNSIPTLTYDSDALGGDDDGKEIISNVMRLSPTLFLAARVELKRTEQAREDDEEDEMRGAFFQALA
jgi:hypothetical protein